MPKLTKAMVMDWQEQLLAGGFCAIWVFGVFLTLLYFMFTGIADTPEQQSFYGIRTVGFFAVTAIASCSHAYLIYIRKKRANGS